VLYRIAWGLDVPPWPAAFVTVAGLLLLTGALHEDGLAEFADGAGGGGTPERRLEIMRDSRIGTYGAATLILSLGLRVSVVAALAEPRAVLLALIAAHAASRGFMVLLAGFQGPARKDGLFASLGGPGPARAIAAGLIGASLAMTSGYRLAGLEAALLAPAAGLFAAGLVGRIAQRRLGGLTGDVLGATQQAAEMAILLSLLTLLP
jgi:adenosylcobinamide-GDP ribazoletransferase